MATATTTTTADPETDPEPTLATEKTTAPSTNTMAAATTPVAVAAATATAATSVPAKPSARDTVLTNDPVVLDGLKQKTAGWPIATKPSNVFGAKGPDGTAWRGLVYKSPAKTPVKAIDPGTVVFAQPMRGYGNVIIIDHGKNYTSIYGYNEALTKKVGDYVRKGETVALVGDSGPLADEALYFEIRKGTLPIDPTIYLATNP
jgi:septal ring factor EnvC (AmiA/AmiB activator)